MPKRIEPSIGLVEEDTAVLVICKLKYCAVQRVNWARVLPVLLEPMLPDAFAPLAPALLTLLDVSAPVAACK